MKKILLTIAGSMFIALATVNAQQQTDTTRTTTTTTTESSTNYREPETQKQESGIQITHWRDEDRESVTREELPSQLVETLKSDEYQGWENATIYRNKTSNDFMLVMQENGTVKTFYFDQEGKSRTTTETTTRSSTEGQLTPGSGISIQTTQPDPKSNAWLAEDRIIILIDDVPASLRGTLADDQYKGWENSTLYRNRKTNEYMVEIRDGSNAKVYYFDKDGKAINTPVNRDQQ